MTCTQRYLLAQLVAGGQVGNGHEASALGELEPEVHGPPGLLQNDGVEGDHCAQPSHLHEVLLVHLLDVQSPGLEELEGQVLPHVVLDCHLEHEVGFRADLC